MSAETKTLFSGTALGLSGPLRVEILPNGMTARLTQPFRVRTGAGRIIEVPAGFETDFASVPRLFWRVVPPWGRYSPAAVVHDYLYHTGKVSRLAADRVFLELMAALGVPACTGVSGPSRAGSSRPKL